MDMEFTLGRTVVDMKANIRTIKSMDRGLINILMGVSIVVNG